MCSLASVLHRVFWAILAVMTPGCLFSPNDVQEPRETSVSGEDQHHSEGEDTMPSLQPRFEDGSYRRFDGVPSFEWKQSTLPNHRDLSWRLYYFCYGCTVSPPAPCLH